MGCGCNKGERKVSPMKNIQKRTVVSGSNNSARVASAVRRIIKKPAR